MFSRVAVRRLLLAAVVVGLFSTPRQSVAADNPISFFPDDTGILVHFRQPTSFIKKVVEFGGQLGPDVGLALAFGADQFNNVIRNVQLKGVDAKGDWFHAVFFRNDGRPGDVTAVKVSDVDAATEGVAGSENFTFANHNGWLFYSRQAWAIKKLESHFRKMKNPATKTIADAFGKDCAKIVKSTDISLFVNVPAIRKEYKEELKALSANIKTELENLQDFDQNEQVDMKAVMVMLQGMVDGLLQAVNDTDGVALGITITKQGMGIESNLALKKGSKTLKTLAQHKATALDTINKLPPGQLLYFAATGNFEAFTKWAAKHIPSIIADKKQRKSMNSLFKAFEGVEPKSFASSFSIGDLKSGVLRTVSIQEAADLNKLRDANRKAGAAAAQANFGPVKTEVEVNKNVETYGSYKADVIRIKPDLDNIPPELDPLGLQKTILEAMYGKGGKIEQRMIYTDKYMVQVVGGKELAQKAVTALAGNTEAKEKSTFGAARRRVGKKANVIFMFDLANFAGTAVRTIASAEQLNLPIKKDMFKEMTFKPSYLSFSLGINEQGVGGKAYLPIEQWKNMATIVRQAIKEFQGGLNPEL